jgi:hypothetical protein
MIDFNSPEFITKINNIASDECSKWRDDNKEKVEELAKLVSIASAALDTAESFCENHGLIFDFWCSPLEQPYISKKAKDFLFQSVATRIEKEILVTEEEIERFTQFISRRYRIEGSIESALSWYYSSDCLFVGWQHSQVGC